MSNIAFVSLLFSFTFGNVVAVCPNWTTPFNATGKCYWFSSFSYSFGWNDAEASCNCIGGHLATIDDAFENAFVDKNTNDTAWIGGYVDFFSNETGWKWTVDGRKVKYTNWNVGTDHSDSNICVQDGIWYVYPSYLSYYVCEIPHEGLSCPRATMSGDNTLSYWTYFSSINTCYQYDGNIFNFSDAVKKYPNIVSIHSSQESAALADYIYNDVEGDDIIWVGIFDPDKNGTFIWFDGTPLDYTNWAQGEPYMTGTNDCAIFTTHFQWESVSCSHVAAVISKTRGVLQKDQSFPDVCTSNDFFQKRKHLKKQRLENKSI